MLLAVNGNLINAAFYFYFEGPKAGSTLAANSRGSKRFLTPSLAAC
jgi:hypothetical protein